MAVHESRLEPRQRHLAQTLAFYADDNGGRIWPSNRTLANNMGVSERAVRYGLEALIKKGVLERDGFHGHVRQFRFNAERLAAYQRGDTPSAVRKFGRRQHPKSGDSVSGSGVAQGGNGVPGSGAEGGNSVPGSAAQRRHGGSANPAIPFTEHGNGVHRTRQPGSTDLHDLQDHQDHKTTGADAPGRSAEAITRGAEPDYGAIAKLVIDDAARAGDLSAAALTDRFHQRCAERRLTPDPGLADAALTSALDALKKSKLGFGEALRSVIPAGTVAGKGSRKGTGPFAMCCHLMQEAIAHADATDHDTSVANVGEVFKTFCAQRGIPYDSELTRKTYDAVQVARSKQARGQNGEGAASNVRRFGG